MSITESQKRIANALSNADAADRGVMEEYERVLEEYWGVHRRNPDDLSFFLRATQKKRPRLFKVIRNITKMYAPVKIVSKNFQIEFENKNDVTKREMAKMKVALQELKNLRLTSLLNHPSIKKVDIQFNWDARKNSLASTMARLMKEHGITHDQLEEVISLAEVKAKKAA